MLEENDPEKGPKLSANWEGKYVSGKLDPDGFLHRVPPKGPEWGAKCAEKYVKGFSNRCSKFKSKAIQV